MNPIKAIVFDLGGVIVDVDYMRYAAGFAEGSGHSAREIADGIFREIHPVYNAGKMTPRQFHRAVLDRFALNIPFERFCRIYADIFSLNKSTVRLISKLKPRYPLCLLSNTDPIHWEYELKGFPVLGQFDHLVLSFEAGAAKPSPEIYQVALAKCGVSPDEAVFIDDMAEYVEGAIAVGMHGIRFHSALQVENEMKGLGVKVA